MNYKFLDHFKEETVLFLHGFLSDHGAFDSLIHDYKDKFNILLIDLPGFGKSKSVGFDYTIDTIADWIIEVLDEVNLEAVHVVGYSMGGRVAASLLYHHEERIGRMVLESTTLGINDEKKRQERIELDEYRALSVEGDYELFCEKWSNLGLFSSQRNLNEDQKKIRDELRLRQNPVEVADSLRKYGTGTQTNFWPIMKSNKKVLILAGERDEKFVRLGNQMLKIFDNATFICIKNVGHNIHLENSVEFNDRVIKFLLEGQ
ncbi:2-succinyl-6-hydroxy-2,4-cyclohexadiene-1-carboxylate synthase [Phocicoccus pinnipedialis]|uniref:2-succinyl-6-hydroxy-2, 4-cyclohexadiene-1-carboxylate synthase n=1 Tax=Phocicoccus pinnipedialis TaxID=110845 RepID=UPI00163E906F|nr:2-succinyl-6-hydroxy-2,4-cyclohexadiene-1-carboxylate synthase [Jeotgalicoccus pinnipedialis]MBP1939576.1 2-succinyl-6-hydroxy-2,4-cyclohexadiene-1-carboxylate synthase [Jeotgalicoccus pinnipedialis]